MKTTLVLFLLFLLPNPAWANDASIKGEARFKVEIAINAASLANELYRTTHLFLVDTKVTNISHRTQEIVAWTNYGWSWLSSSPEVGPEISTLSNGPSRIVLRPGESYARTVGMGSSSLRPVTFRLGFVPKTEDPASARLNPADNGEIFWSNYVTLTR